MGELSPISTEYFLDLVYDEYKADQRFCFIIGSGASYTSGIRTGEKLMKEWFEYLSKRGIRYIKECAQKAGYSWDECKDIFESPQRPLKNSDYFTLYDLRYAGRPLSGYDALLKEMEGKTPNIGYYYLASILENTDNKFIITTNFDSLTEDAFFYTFCKRPLVLGDERLARYIHKADHSPVIAKIHRDLLMDPINNRSELDGLKDDWKKPLESILSKYIPIVIGYAGGDKSLMTFLEGLELKSIFWCEIDKREPCDEAKEIIKKCGGSWVKIQGFDELMYRLVDTEYFNIKPSADEMRTTNTKRLDEYEKRANELRQKYSISSDKDDEFVRENMGMIQAVMRDEENDDSSLAEYNELLSNAISCIPDDKEKALELCTQAINMRPNEAKGYSYRGIVYRRKGVYDKAVADCTRAIDLNPDYAAAYNNRGYSLDELQRYEEAIADYTKAIELKPDYAFAYNNRGIAFRKLQRYEEAIADYTKAIELNPYDAAAYYNRGSAFDDLQRYEGAIADYNKAIDLKPDYAAAYNNRGITFDKLQRYEEAIADYTKAIELNPD